MKKTDIRNINIDNGFAQQCVPVIHTDKHAHYPGTGTGSKIWKEVISNAIVIPVLTVMTC